MELHHYFNINSVTGDHFYTDESQRRYKFKWLRYMKELLAITTLTTPLEQSLHHFYNSAISDHFYMTDETKINAPSWRSGNTWISVPRCGLLR